VADDQFEGAPQDLGALARRPRRPGRPRGGGGVDGIQGVALAGVGDLRDGLLGRRSITLSRAPSCAGRQTPRMYRPLRTAARL